MKTPCKMRRIRWRKTIYIKKEGFPRQARRKENKTLKINKFKHYAVQGEEDEGEHQGEGNKTTSEHLVKRQQQCQTSRGIGHQLTNYGLIKGHM